MGFVVCFETELSASLTEGFVGFWFLKVGEEHRRGRGFCGILGSESERRES